MDDRVKDIYAKFIKNRKLDKAYEVLAASYAEDKKGTYPLIRKYRQGQTILAKLGGREAMDLLKAAYFLTARDYFDDFCIAMEWNRDIKNRFYTPRRKQLLPVVEQMQRLTDEEIDVLAVSMPPGVGKTGLAQFYIDFTVGRDPKGANLIASHNTNFLRGLYDEFLRQLDPDGDEYAFYDIFPDRKIVKTNAQDLKIDINKAQRFSSIQHRSIQGGNAGLSRCVFPGVLYIDDPVEGVEEAMSEERLEAKWTKINTDLIQRVLGRLRLLIIGTRWSLRDPIGRLQAQYENDPRAVFMTMPALDKYGNSNFDYGGNIGYTTEALEKIKALQDPTIFAALYQNEPVERSGILFHSEDLRRYTELPAEEPDAVWAVCDTKNKGDDYFCMPIAYQYGDNYYIDKIICDNREPRLVEPRLVDALVLNGVKLARFESNSAGGRIAESVQEKVVERGGITKITTRYSTANKDTRILGDSPFIKDRFLFKDQSIYASDSEYRLAMNMLFTYSNTGRSRHDDVPDALSMLANFVQVKHTNKAIVVKRPF